MRDRTWVIAKREWKTTVLRREFLLVTLGLPLLFLFFGGLSMVGVFMTATRAGQSASQQPVGISDPTHVLTPAAFAKPLDSTTYQMVSHLGTGRNDVAGGRLRALLVVPPDYVRNGTFSIYRKASNSIFGDGNSSQSKDVYAVALRAGLIWKSVPPAVTARVAIPGDKDVQSVYEWNPKTRLFQKPDAMQEAARFLVPYIFSLLLMTTIFIGTGYLMHGIVEEKENRIMEVLLSSVSHEQILRGKLIGLGGAGLTQIGVWALLAGIPALIALSRLPTSLRVSPVMLLAAIILFALGFGLYGTLMAGIGSLGTSWRESQQITGVVTMFAVIPLILIVPILDMPNGILARLLSWFPPTAPITLMLRMASGSVPWWDFSLGVLLLILSIWFLQKISAKIFRLGLLLYGKVPSAAEVFRWIRVS